MHVAIADALKRGAAELPATCHPAHEIAGDWAYQRMVALWPLEPQLTGVCGQLSGGGDDVPAALKDQPAQSHHLLGSLWTTNWVIAAGAVQPAISSDEVSVKLSLMQRAAHSRRGLLHSNRGPSDEDRLRRTRKALTMEPE